MSPPIPRPRSSGHTQVGLGVVETRNGGDITPPSGVDLETLSQMGVEEGVLYLGEQVKRLADEEHKAHTVIVRAAAHAEMAERAVDALEERSEVRHKELLAAISGLSDALGDVAAKVVDLDLQIGRAPEKVDLTRASQVGDLTAEELTQLEQGTGLMGLVGRLVAGLARARATDKELSEALAKKLGRLAGIRAGVSAGATAALTSSPTWGPPLLEMLKNTFGG